MSEAKPFIRFKKLSDEDIEQMRQLNEVFAAAFEEPDTYLGKKPGDEYLGALLKKDHVLAYVALDGQRVVGGNDYVV